MVHLSACGRAVTDRYDPLKARTKSENGFVIFLFFFLAGARVGAALSPASAFNVRALQRFIDAPPLGFRAGKC